MKARPTDHGPEAIGDRADEAENKSCLAYDHMHKAQLVAVSVRAGPDRRVSCVATVTPPTRPNSPFTPAEQEAYERLKARLLAMPEVPESGLEHDVVDSDGNSISYRPGDGDTWLLLDLDEQRPDND